MIGKSCAWEPISGWNACNANVACYSPAASYFVASRQFFRKLKMNPNHPNSPHILFLFSDTGGGHRSATEAIIEAIHLEFDQQIITEKVDFFKEYAPPFFRKMPDWYPHMVRPPQSYAYGLGFHLSDGPAQARFMNDTAWPYVRKAARKLVEDHPSDLIVCLHPVANAPMLRILGDRRPPFVTVVTDLVTTHALWFNPRADLCIVPTEGARMRAMRYGMRPEQVKVIGLPVANRFCQPPCQREVIRSRLGWPQDRPVIVLVGGGEGMGPLEVIADAIAEANLPAALVIITGRNQKLREHLSARTWPMPTFIDGFVSEMPDYMAAADILVTKAGPGTISEAFNAGLPLILYSRLPGQEEGNVTYVVEEAAGVWAPHPDLIVSVLQNWIEHPEQRAKAAAACRRLARPNAARQIARTLASKIGLDI
jgi:1,2-diacylglycerol 3-beta-galactosyltransferase